MSTVYKVTFQYLGAHFNGWQIQKETDQTIQGHIVKALRQLAKSESVSVLGSGRTDARVHATGQVGRVEIPLAIADENFIKALNSFLPDSIRAIDAQKVEENFHPIAHTSWKQYCYVFTNEKCPPPFLKEITANIAHELDFRLMEKGLELFRGKHDFLNYYKEGSNFNTSVKTLFEAELHTSSIDFIPEVKWPIYTIRLKGDGFLRQMCRLIVGALWALGARKISLSDIQRSFEKKQAQKLAASAAPNGLYLSQVQYDGFKAPKD